jgi:hypothetical protein
MVDGGSKGLFWGGCWIRLDKYKDKMAFSETGWDSSEEA